MLQTLKDSSVETLAAIAAEMAVRKTSEVFLLFPLGSQFDHLIKQRLEKQGVFCLVADPASVTAEDVKRIAPKGIVVSGGPVSVYADPPKFDCGIFDLDIPGLAICLGFQLLAQHRGHVVERAAHREYGVHRMQVRDPLGGLFLNWGTRDTDGWHVHADVLESHGDRVLPAPGAGHDMRVLGVSQNTPVAAAYLKPWWGVQFHPEVSDTQDADRLFHNFCFTVCDARDRFPAADVVQEKVRDLRAALGGGKKVLLALSGGCDSNVVAYLLRAALTPETAASEAGEPLPELGRVRCVYIKGIDRPTDEFEVHSHFGHQPWADLKIVDASAQFLAAVAGKRSMHAKRMAMRGVYKDILECEAHLFGADYIAQGTLYTDVSESGGGYDSGAKKHQIKQHHNVNLGFKVPELTPLSDQVKDGVRQIGKALGVPDAMLWRHPFPGPGLLVRIENKVKLWKLRVARHADVILVQELKAAGLFESVWQAGAVVTASRTTVTKGDGAGIGSVIALFAVSSVNGFTARPFHLPWDVLERVSQRITNEIPEVGRVVYNLSGKPPATIEWG